MFKKLSASLFALVALAVSAPAQADVCGPGVVCVIGDRLRSEWELLQQFDDTRETVKNSLEYLGYENLLSYIQNDPVVITSDNDARCSKNAKTKTTLGSKTTANTTDAQKVQAAQDLINQFKSNAPSTGGLGAALPAGSGRPARPSGWSSAVSAMPKNSEGFRIMTVIFVDGSSIGVKLTIPGGSGGDPAGATIVTSQPPSTALAFIRTPAQTAPFQPNKAECPF